MQHQSLLEKYLEGKCNHEELTQLYNVLQQGNVDDYEDIIHDIWLKLQDAPKLSDQRSERIFASIQSDIRTTPGLTVPIYKKWPFYGVAASLLLCIAAAILFLNQPEMVEVSTAYQETKSLTLPDGTKVMLNANSSIRYSEDLLSQPSREIWIKGEAFFEVKSLTYEEASQKVPFIVHTDMINIRVLGTQFNVKDRHGKAEVVLTEGKIRLSQAQNPTEKLDMEPGQKVLADAQSGLHLSRVEDPNFYTSWKENELYFENQTLASIAQEIHDEFGITVEFADPKLSELKFTGSAPADQLEVLLVSIEKSFNLNIRKDENRYVIASMPNP
jgi:ferric-dicitrate binding protein FerR (iron transport regulator)